MVLSSSRKRARLRNLPFDLDLGWLVGRYEAQDGRCAVSGIPLEFPAVRADGRDHTPWPWAPSLDRIDSRAGYVKENTRLVAVSVNVALGAWGEAVLDRLARSYLAWRRRAKARRPDGCPSVEKPAGRGPVAGVCRPLQGRRNKGDRPCPRPLRPS